MKRLLPLFLLLQISVTAVEPAQKASTVRNWYFDHYVGETVTEVRGVRVGEKTETLIIERGVGRYIDDHVFVVTSEVDSEAGDRLMSGTTRWERVGDHFEADIRAGSEVYRGVLRLDLPGKARVEIFTGKSRMNRGEFRLQDGMIRGRIDIYDAAGNVATVCTSESRKR